MPLLMLLPAVVVLVSIFVYPMIYSIRYALTNLNLSTGTSSFVGLTNFVEAFRDQRFLGSLVTTAIYVIAATGLEFALGLGLAMIISKESRSQNIFLPILLLPIMVTPVVMGLMWKYMLHSDVGIINYFLHSLHLPTIPFLSSPVYALWALIALDVWMWTPFMCLLLLAGLVALPAAPYEAAQIDGASGWRVFRKITLPQLRPVILVALLLRTIDAMRAFDTIFITTQGGPGAHTEVVSLFIYKVAFSQFRMGYALALSWIFVVVATVVARLFIKYLPSYVSEEA